MRIDLDIKSDIEDELLWDPRVTETEIGVIVDDGVVTLTGTVDSLPTKWAAEEAALRVKGVKAVANDVEVRIPDASERSDEDIARAAAAALEWNVTIPEGVQATVDNGWVTLSGQVEWQYQKSAAKNAVEKLTGVKGVFNNITVKTKAQASTSDVKKKIESTLARHASLDAKAITVKTHDGTVTLEGTVHSWAERNAVEDAAWSAPGVTEVEDRLVVI